MCVSTEQGRPIFSVPTKSASCDPRDHHCVELITDSNCDIWLMCILWALFFLVSSRVSGHVPCGFSRAEPYLAFLTGTRLLRTRILLEELPNYQPKFTIWLEVSRICTADICTADTADPHHYWARFCSVFT